MRLDADQDKKQPLPNRTLFGAPFRLTGLTVLLIAAAASACAFAAAVALAVVIGV